MTGLREATASSTTLTYVYGVVPSSFSSGEPPSGVAGEIALVEAGPVAALVSTVPLEDFGPDALALRLEDLAWVERQARAHERVLEWALATGPVVPFRLCTLYGSASQLDEFLTANASELEGLLERLRGTVERGVKAFVDVERLEALLQGDGEHASSSPGSGRDYMLSRQRERELATQVERTRLAWAGAAHARLREVALDAVLLDLQPRELTGRPDEMLLNGAYLVRTDDRRFSAAAEALADDANAVGVTVETTGPWPPYNFVPRKLGAS